MSFFTWHIIKKNTLESSNKTLMNGKYDDFTCLWTEEQTQGRGRFNRVWNSVPLKDLTFSCVFPLSHIVQKNWNNTAQIVALAVSKTLESLDIRSGIKWPNDVLVNGKKICGILCEIMHDKSRDSASSKAVLGIGLNINSDTKDLQIINQEATSLFVETHTQYDRTQILTSILDTLSKELQHISLYGFDGVYKDIRQRLIKSTKSVTIKTGTKHHEGFIVDINNDGSLQFECKTCGLINIYSGDTSF